MNKLTITILFLCVCLLACAPLTTSAAVDTLRLAQSTSATGTKHLSYERLYRIRENDLYGFIDTNGTTIIKPQFHSAGEFSEGLAPARLHGRYGFIDRTGNYVIAANYALAFSFSNGIAQVFIERKPYFIDHSGTIIFGHTFKNIAPFGNTPCAIVEAAGGTFGVINRQGILIADTIFKEITPFSDGVAVVKGLNNYQVSRNSTQLHDYEIGVIDTLGNWVVKYGKYARISTFEGGYAEVELISQDTSSDHTSGFVDTKGRFSTYKYQNSEWRTITRFSCNRAFAQKENSNWYVINERFEKVSTQDFSRICDDNNGLRQDSVFVHGIATVYTNNRWRIIDTNGAFMAEPPALNRRDYGEVIKKGTILFFIKENNRNSNEFPYLYGFWNTANNIVVPPEYEYIEIDDYNKDLIFCIKGNQSGYLTPSGKLLLTGKITTDSPNPLNIDYMNRAYCFAASDNNKSSKIGDSSQGVQIARPISQGIYKSADIPEVRIDTNQQKVWGNLYKGYGFTIANPTSDTLYFEAQDNCIEVVLQAKDKDGHWNDIEYQPSSWCGNSYHTLFLAPKQRWEFIVPKYQGTVSTKIRAKLMYKKKLQYQTDEEYLLKLESMYPNFKQSVQQLILNEHPPAKNDLSEKIQHKLELMYKLILQAQLKRDSLTAKAGFKTIGKRQMLADRDRDHSKETEVVIYSNEIEGSVNPGQFWNKKRYHPNGIMDPYFE